MKVYCAKCRKEYSLRESVAIVYDPEDQTTEYFCSEDCAKEYDKTLPKIQYIKFEKGGEE